MTFLVSARRNCDFSLSYANKIFANPGASAGIK